MKFTKASYCRKWLSTREKEVLSSWWWKKKSGCPLLVSCGGAAGDACVGCWEWVQSSEGHLASLPALALHSTVFGIMTSLPSIATSLFHLHVLRHGLSEGKSHWIIVSSSRLHHSPNILISSPPQVSESTHPFYYTFARERERLVNIITTNCWWWVFQGAMWCARLLHPNTDHIDFVARAICLATVHSPPAGDARFLSSLRCWEAERGNCGVCCVAVYSLTPIFITDLRYAHVFWVLLLIRRGRIFYCHMPDGHIKEIITYTSVVHFPDFSQKRESRRIFPQFSAIAYCIGLYDLIN